MYTRGDHFGEFSLVSTMGLRIENAQSENEAELYSIHESDFWQMLQYLTFLERRRLLIDIMTMVGKEYHTSPKLDLEDATHDNVYMSMSRFAYFVMTEIVNSPFINDGGDDENGNTRSRLHAIQSISEGVTLKQMRRDSTAAVAIKKRIVSIQQGNEGGKRSHDRRLNSVASSVDSNESGNSSSILRRSGKRFSQASTSSA
jgi:hypothetical protein